MRVLVLSHTRCGSTTLCKWLSKELDMVLDENPYEKKTFNDTLKSNNSIRKIVVEEYFPTKEEISKFDKVIFLTRISDIDAAISYMTANDLKEWHKEYEVTLEWIEENKIKIINISNNIKSLKMKLNDYAGFHITYEDLYVNKSCVDRVLEYINVSHPKYLDMLDYDKKYRKDNNTFIKDKRLKLI